MKTSATRAALIASGAIKPVANAASPAKSHDNSAALAARRREAHVTVAPGRPGSFASYAVAAAAAIAREKLVAGRADRGRRYWAIHAYAEPANASETVRHGFTGYWAAERFAFLNGAALPRRERFWTAVDGWEWKWAVYVPVAG